MSLTPPTPTGPLAYLGERIDRAAQASFANTVLARRLPAHGIACFRPADGWSGGIFSPTAVEAVNRLALLSADVMVADFLDGGATIGLPMEVAVASAAGIPVVAMWPENVARSVSLQATPGVTFVADKDAAVEAAVQLAQTHYAARAFVATPARPQLRFSIASGATPPRQGLADDCGLDLVTSVDTVVPPKAFVDIPSVVLGTQIPEGMWALITGRSSAIRKLGLLVPNGVIDHGWRGPLMAGVYNLNDHPVTVRAGDRVAQVILMPNLTETVDVVQTDKIEPHERGVRGFGSTGLGHDEREELEELEELEGLRETVAILSDPQLVADIAEAEADVAAGRLVHLSDVAPPAERGGYCAPAEAIQAATGSDPLAATSVPPIIRGGTQWPLAEAPGWRTPPAEPVELGPLHPAIDSLPWASEGERLQALDGPGAKPVTAWEPLDGRGGYIIPGPVTVTDSDGRQSVATEIRVTPLEEIGGATPPVWTDKQIQTAGQEQAEYDRIDAGVPVNPDAWT